MSTWKTFELDSIEATLLLLQESAGKGWLFRGQGRSYEGALRTSIDRPPRESMARSAKIQLERQSIDVFRSASRSFAHEGEEDAMTDDLIALTVLRHYGVPTRVLDWSRSPHVAAYFASCSHPDCDGEIWSFSHLLYQRYDRGPAQWRRCPETTRGGTGDASDFDQNLTAFNEDEPCDWFICVFYDEFRGFPRQRAQHGAFTFTSRFGRDHAVAIAELLRDDSAHVRYRLKRELKLPLLRELESHGISHGTLYPDTAGAAEAAKWVFG